MLWTTTTTTTTTTTGRVMMNGVCHAMPSLVADEQVSLSGFGLLLHSLAVCVRYIVAGGAQAKANES